MGDHAITNELISPTVNDVHGGVAGDGVNTLEKYAAPWRKGVERAYIVSGFVIPTSSGTLDLAIPLGKALISGYYVSVPGATTVTCAASTTNHIFLKLLRDGFSNVSEAKFEVNTTGTPQADSVKIGTATTSGSAVTSTQDSRLFTPLAPSLPYGPRSIGAGSTVSHEGDVIITSNQNLSGVHFYRTFTLNAGVTLTVPPGGRALVIWAEQSITIHGTITAQGAGGLSTSVDGTSQSGGGGGGGGADNQGVVNGSAGAPSGIVRVHGVSVTSATGGGGGIAGASGPGGGNIATAQTGNTALKLLNHYQTMGGTKGGNGGASGGGAGGGSGGAGGGDIVLVAPSIALGAAAVLNTTGNNGGDGTDGTNGGGAGGGGGGAGNIWIRTNSFTNNGATFSQSGGANGNGGGGGANGQNGAGGGAGAAGFKQIEVYE